MVNSGLTIRPMRGSFAAVVPAGVPATQNISQRPNHVAVDPIVRWTFYVFVMSIPFEYPPRSIPVEVHTITGSIFLLTALLQPKVCFRKPPKAFWWLAIYLFVYLTLMALYSKDIPNATIFFFNMLQAAFLFWASYNLLRFDAIVKTTFLSFAIS